MPPTISPEPTVEGGFDGGSRPDVAAAEKPWYTKPVLGVPVGVAVALGIAGLVLWRRKGGGAKKMAYSRRKARRLTRR
jgi:predicted polyphosphate/ATP-dependent NAD kinase